MFAISVVSSIAVVVNTGHEVINLKYTPGYYIR